jgi:hypothetical protein
MTRTQTGALLALSLGGIVVGFTGFMWAMLVVDGSDVLLASAFLLFLLSLGGMGWALSEPLPEAPRPTLDPVTPDTGLYRRRTTADMQTFLSEHGETLREALTDACEYDRLNVSQEMDEADAQAHRQRLSDFQSAEKALEALLYARPATDGPTTLWYFGPDHDSRDVYFGEYASRDDAELEATRQRHNPRYASGTFVTEL